MNECKDFLRAALLIVLIISIPIIGNYVTQKFLPYSAGSCYNPSYTSGGCDDDPVDDD